jgi:hypothetical protein
VRKARKEHKCTECGSVIKKGEEYEYISGMWDGTWDFFKTCQDCIDIRESLSMMECFCWSHGGLAEDLSNQFAWAEFTPGEKFAHLRVLAKHRRWGRTKKNRRNIKCSRS